MTLHNPNNWHWVTKDVSAWSSTWFENNLTTLSAEEGSVKARISKVLSSDGDVDVSQRKGKVITYYDVKLVLEYAGSTPDEEDVTGSITIPEVAHDTPEDGFVFDIDVYSDSTAKQPVKDLVREKLVPQIRKALIGLPDAIITEHAKDIQHGPKNPPLEIPPAKVHPPTGLAAIKAAEEAKAKAAAAAAKAATEKRGHVVNTTTVTDAEEFRTTAEQLYQTFTDPQRLAAFTRAAPRVFEGAQPGGKFELFDGNVTGAYTELKAPTHIVQSWRLKQWPEGHHSTLTIDFDQNDVDGVTTMRVEWTGVPVGQEDVTKRNWSEYYVRSIKKTFGFGTIL